MTSQEKLEKNMRERLEKSGQMGKMRAMIVEAALQALYTEDTENSSDNQSEKQQQPHFLPSTSLTEAKSSSQGRELLANVYQFLEYLGLEYTASVFCMEAGLPTDKFGAIKHSDTPESQSVFMEKLNFGGLTSLPHTGTNDLQKHESNLEEASLNKSSEAHNKNENDLIGNLDEEQVGGEDTTYNISSWKSRSFVRANGLVTGQQVQLEYLTDCTVLILDPLDSITVDDCEGGQLIIAACEGSVFLRNCKDMHVHVACKQLRMRDCAELNICVFTTTDPVIEMSHHIAFRPFHLSLPDLKKSFTAARLNPKLNRFVHVYDFNANDSMLPQPHFTIMYPKHGLSLEARYAEYGAPECPEEIEQLLKGTLLPAASSESGENKSFDIKDGAKIWASMGDADSDENEEAPTMPTVKFIPQSSSSTTAVREDGKNNAFGEGNSASHLEVPKTNSLSVGGPTGRPPAVPNTQIETGCNTNNADTSLDDHDYSSFEDESVSTKDDKYEVDEDDDDF